MHAAVHTRGIVYHDTTYHGSTDRCRIGWEHTSVWLQYLINPRPHYTRLQRDALGCIRKHILLPMLASHNEHAVGTALS